MANITKGSEIAERFVMTECLGRGANGEVWKATDKHARRDVAIKLLLNPGKDEMQRLLHEAGKWAALEHENILRLYDVRATDGMLVMECADGGSLERMMRTCVLKGGGMSHAPACSYNEAIKIFGDILRGLAFAHEKGILHGDLKPGNILMSRYGTAKISDFGMARERRDGAFSLTTGVDHAGMSGTPEYMSPEQARREDVDLQSDIFAAGIVGYQLFSGLHPFCHPSLVVSPREMIADMDVCCRSLGDVAPQMSQQIVGVVDRMLAKDRTVRYSSVREILSDMEDESATVTCIKCSASNPVTNRYCGQCGLSLASGRIAGEQIPVEEESAEKLVEDGYEFATRGEWISAIECYRKAIEADVEYQKAYGNLGYALNHLGLYDEAIQELTKGIELGDHPALYGYRAFALKNLRQYEDALSDLEQALTERPRDTSLLRDKIHCLLEIGDTKKAYSTVLQALRYAPKDERLTSLRHRLEENYPEIKTILGRT